MFKKEFQSFLLSIFSGGHTPKSLVTVLKKRQKLIKIVNKKRDGWLVVQEYESDDLASDSEVEKKLRKAKAVAEKKRNRCKARVTAVPLRKNLRLLVIFSFPAVLFLLFKK